MSSVSSSCAWDFGKLYKSLIFLYMTMAWQYADIGFAPGFCSKNVVDIIYMSLPAVVKADDTTIYLESKFCQLQFHWQLEAKWIFQLCDVGI